MTEANTPSNQQHSPESFQSDASNWYTGWGDFDTSGGNSSDSAQSSSSDDWQPIEFPNTINLKALEEQSQHANSSEKASPCSTRILQPNTDLTGWNEAIQAVPPNVEELISLIQELNQCNSALLDRVSQLEDALERQSVAIGQIGQPVEGEASFNQSEGSAQDQIAYLFNQLEFAHQTSQRQQILIETLTEQLESSQERVAQLERECALTQQRYNEQSHQLAQSEDACRDLRTRLHRQQRYTLQFKAALEKCLEVPAPSYESPNETTALTQAQPWYEAQSSLMPPFLPKVARIQPWSSSSEGLFNFDLPNVAPAESDRLEETESEASPSTTSSAPTLPPVVAPIVQLQTQSATPTVSYNLKSPTSVEPTLEQAIDDALNPIEELETQSSHSPLQLPPEVSLTANPDDLEAAVWQDLARLIDQVSTEEVLKASLANDFSAFEAVLSNVTEATLASAIDQSPEVELSPAQSTPATKGIIDSIGSDPQSHVDSNSKQTLVAEESPSPVNADASETASGFTQTSSGPSPIVYPLRPHKKLKSLAAVDLPTFPR